MRCAVTHWLRGTPSAHHGPHSSHLIRTAATTLTLQVSPHLCGLDLSSEHWTNSLPFCSKALLPALPAGVTSPSSIHSVSCSSSSKLGELYLSLTWPPPSLQLRPSFSEKEKTKQERCNSLWVLRALTERPLYSLLLSSPSFHPAAAHSTPPPKSTLTASTAKSRQETAAPCLSSCTCPSACHQCSASPSLDCSEEPCPQNFQQ